MKRGLYIAQIELCQAGDGVANKVRMQTRAMDRLGFEMDVAAYGNGVPALFHYENGEYIEIASGGHSVLPRRLTFLRFVYRQVRRKAYDMCYTRFPYCSVQLLRIFRTLKNRGADVYLEIPTYPVEYPLMYETSFIRKTLMRLLYALDRVTSPRMKRYVKKAFVIGAPATDYHGIPAVSIPNGTDLTLLKPRTPQPDPNELHILFYASFYLYQGADRLIAGMKEYYERKSEAEPDVVLELAGDGPERQAYMEEAEKDGMTQRVVFHGFVSGDAGDALFDRCGLACSVLAAHRSGFRYASPLKTREYFARGIPFVYTYTETGLEGGYPYALRIDSSEAPIDIRRLVAFYDTYKDRQDEVVREMRDYADKHYEWKEILKDIKE